MSDSQTILTRSPEETWRLGAQLGKDLTPGELVAFTGDLGAGKTCMIQGICAGLAVADRVNSPTFILINEYQGQWHGEPLPVYHFDLYRLRTTAELEDLGAEEYFYSQGICLVEWAERAGALLPPQRREVSLEYRGPQERCITLRKILPPPAHTLPARE